MIAALQLEDLAVHFGGVNAVDGVTISIARGELVGLIGPNGAGKTTLIRIVAGAVKPDRGRVVLAGSDVTGNSTASRVRKGLALTHQMVRPFREMTVLDNVVLAAGYRRTANPLRAALSVGRKRERERAAEILVRVGLSGTEDKLSGSLPLGQMKRLEVARALAVDPQIILFDEPLAGLNQTEASRQIETIAGRECTGHYRRAGGAQSRRGHALLPAAHRAQRRPRHRRWCAAGGDGNAVVREAYVGSGSRGPCSALSTSTAAMARCAPCMMSSFEVPTGSVFALLGPNGAGKTSTIMAIMGHVDIYAGRIVFDDVDITRRRAVDRVDLGIALVPEGRQLFSDLTVGENLTVGGYARPLARDAAKRDRVFGYFPRLYERRSAACRFAVRRRAADARHRPRFDGRAAAASGRRTLARADAKNGRSLPRRADEAQGRRPEHSSGRAEHRACAGCCRPVCVLSSGVQVFAGTAEEARAAGSLFTAFLSAGSEQQM